MTNEILLAVPNISTAHTDPLARATALALDIHVDVDHSRSVITYGGTPGVVREEAMALVATTVKIFDLRQHTGVHPRFGVLDVLPLIPYGTDEQAAKDVADDLKRSIEDLGVPVHLYGRADPEGRTLPALRRFLSEHAHDAHPTAGVVCLGIRNPLIAFNVDIRGPVAAAKRIANKVRSEDIRSLGFELTSRGISQVSMNLVAPDVVGPKEAFDRVARLAEEAGVAVADCEVVGLVPEPNLAELEGLPLIRPARSIEQALAERGVP